MSLTIVCPDVLYNISSPFPDNYVITFFFTADFTNDFWYRVQFSSVCCCCGSLEGLVGSFLYILLFGGLHLSSVIRAEMIFSTPTGMGWGGSDVHV